jgi:hypothetical protein
MKEYIAISLYNPSNQSNPVKSTDNMLRPNKPKAPMRYLLYLLPLLLPATSHAMVYHYQPGSAVIALHALLTHPLPSQMNITAEINVSQKNGTKFITRFLYFKKESDCLVPTTGGLIAGHQNTESHDLTLALHDLSRLEGNAIFQWFVSNNNKDFRGYAAIPFDKSCTNQYSLPICDAYNKPIILTITSTVKK